MREPQVGDAGRADRDAISIADGPILSTIFAYDRPVILRGWGKVK